MYVLSSLYGFLSLERGEGLNMKLSGAILVLSGALAVAGCTTSAAHAHHRRHVAAPAPSPSATTQSVVNTAQSRRTCRDVRAWLPAAWSEDPPHFTRQLTADQVKARGALGTDMAALLDGIIGLPPGQYMGTSTGILAIQDDCASIGVKITLPRVAPTARCWHRLHRWLSGPVQGDISSIDSSMSLVSKYSTSNIYDAVIALHLVAVASGIARSWPIPSCADPDHYWAAFLTNEIRMGNAVGSPVSDASNGYVPNAAIADQQHAQSAFSKLTRELAQTTGHHPFG